MREGFEGEGFKGVYPDHDVTKGGERAHATTHKKEWRERARARGTEVGEDGKRGREGREEDGKRRGRNS